MISASSANGVRVPGNGSYARQMPSKVPDKLALLGVPNLSFTGVSTNSQVSPPLRPRDRGDRIVDRHLTEPCNSRGTRAPDVNSPAESNSKYVQAAPVDQIEIKVVLKLRGI